MKDMRLTQVRRQERYGIKKLSVGVASVLVATTLYFLPGSAQVLAASQTSEENSTSQLAPAPSSDAGDQAAPATDAAPAGQSDAAQADSAKPADQAPSAGQAEGNKPADASQASDGTQASEATKPEATTQAATDATAGSPTATPAVTAQVAPANQAPEIPAGHFRMHFAKLPSDNISEIGAWVWGSGVQAPSDNWPTGAMRFSEDKKTA